ncbi:MAG: DUF134 domain-containing protein [Candidatus Riflebacteria bacterium]|nr:DUF134 domain-containing protein [Candidatus Riflebacteria bacterium]
MVRPHSCRRVTGQPGASVFKPAGIPGRLLERVVMTLDEFEAIRLADGEGLLQEEASTRMGISRPTFGRILETAHRKVATVLTRGLALHIEGGPVHTGPWAGFACRACSHEWLAPADPAKPADECPSCHGHDLERNEPTDTGDRTPPLQPTEAGPDRPPQPARRDDAPPTATPDRPQGAGRHGWGGGRRGRGPRRPDAR